jgi:hypothetical protein
MAALTPIAIAPTGLAPAYVAAAAGGDTIKVDNLQRHFLVVKNASGASINVTIAAQRTSIVVPGAGTLTVPNLVIAVPATTGERWIGPFSDAYIDAASNVAVTYSAVTSVTVAAVVLGKVD